MILSYFNKANPVFSTITGDIEKVVGAICNAYIKNKKEEIDPAQFDKKEISIIGDRLVFKDTELNINIKQSDNPLEVIRSVGEELYVFDTISIYHYKDNKFKEIDIKDYETTVCSVCGKIVKKKETIDKMCEDCFLSVGIEKIFNDSKDINQENYTDYEYISKIFNVVDNFKYQISCYLSKYEKVLPKAKELVTTYVYKQDIPEKLKVKIVGGFVA